MCYSPNIETRMIPVSAPAASQSLDIYIYIFYARLQGSSTPVCAPGTSEHVRLIVESQLELYTCGGRYFNSTDPAYPGPVQRAYNELATLMEVPGQAHPPCA